jgi:hypothetical protein
MHNERRQLRIQSVPGRSLVDTRGNSMDTIHTIRLPAHRPASRQSDPVPIGVAVAEAYAAIAARSRKATRRLRTQAAQTLRQARPTG